MASPQPCPWHPGVEQGSQAVRKSREAEGAAGIGRSCWDGLEHTQPPAELWLLSHPWWDLRGDTQGWPQGWGTQGRVTWTLQKPPWCWGLEEGGTQRPLCPSLILYSEPALHNHPMPHGPSRNGLPHLPVTPLQGRRGFTEMKNSSLGIMYQSTASSFGLTECHSKRSGKKPSDSSVVLLLKIHTKVLLTNIKCSEEEHQE